MHTCIHTHIHRHVHIYVHIYIHTHVCLHTQHTQKNPLTHACKSSIVHSIPHISCMCNSYRLAAQPAVSTDPTRLCVLWSDCRPHVCMFVRDTYAHTNKRTTKIRTRTPALTPATPHPPSPPLSHTNTRRGKRGSYHLSILSNPRCALSSQVATDRTRGLYAHPLRN